VGAAVGALNPFGWLEGSRLAFATAGAATSALTNGANQMLGARSFDATSFAVSAAGGAIFGGIAGVTNSVDFGIPVQGTLIQSLAKGVSGGLIGFGTSSATIVSF
jgi:hypothetical protein